MFRAIVKRLIARIIHYFIPLLRADMTVGDYLQVATLDFTEDEQRCAGGSGSLSPDICDEGYNIFALNYVLI
jgi:hypothetical protein